LVKLLAKEAIVTKGKVTLIGPLSLAVGRFRFTKDKPVIVSDAELLKYCQGSHFFKVEIFEAEKAAPKKAAPAPKPQPKVTAPKPEPKKEEPKAKPEEKKESPKKLSKKVRPDGEGA
jgi:outer membrane biosynthesis protein TonB